MNHPAKQAAKRDGRLALALMMLLASAAVLLVQVWIVSLYLYSALNENWSYFLEMFPSARSWRGGLESVAFPRDCLCWRTAGGGRRSSGLDMLVVTTRREFLRRTAPPDDRGESQRLICQGHQLRIWQWTSLAVNYRIRL
jgi:hypothetical protein